MRIAMVSEHASPLAVLGGVDAGGQNVHVAALASALARRGDDVVVHTRRDDPGLARRVELAPGVEVDHVDAGPPTEVPKDELLAHMAAFAADLREQWLDERPDVVHTHFWMSALAALEASDGLGIPIVHTFHALGTVKRRHQGDRDTSARRSGSSSSAGSRARSTGSSPPAPTRSSSCCGWAPTGTGSRSSRAASISSASTSRGPVEPRGPRPRLLAACRLVERKGLADAVTALADVPDVELHVAGGPEAAALDADPEAQRLRSLADRSRRLRPAGAARARRARRDAAAAALRRRRRVRAVVRAVRDRPARGDGLRRAGGGDRGRRADRLRRARRRPACTSRRAIRARWPAPCASLLADPGRRVGLRRGGGARGRSSATASSASRAPPARSTRELADDRADAAPAGRGAAP